MSAGTDPNTSTTTTTEAPTSLTAEPAADVDAVDAHVCGALGCHEDDDLRRARHPDRGTRVLCPSHATHFENGGGRR